MPDLRRVVLDVLKPHDPPMLEFTERLASAESVGGISTSLLELDQEVQNVEITIEGEALDFPAIEEAIEDLGGSVHSVDQAAFGQDVAKDRRAPRDD